MPGAICPSIRDPSVPPSLPLYIPQYLTQILFMFSTAILIDEMSQFALFEFSLTCTPDQEFVPCGKAVFQKNFLANKGVRQGGVLSPVLFTVYIDVLLNRLENSRLGCYVAHEYFGALCSADGLALLAPNFTCLKSMIHICESFAQEYDLLFNAKKAVCILFQGSV